MKNLENNIYCSLIEDLLPLYIENMVNEETKKEIENHLKECPECAALLDSIKNDNVFDIKENEVKNQTSNKEKEIKCIKNIRKRFILKTVLAIIITIILVVILSNLWNTYRFVKDEDGNWILYNFSTGNIKKGLEGTNIIANYTLNYDGTDIQHEVIFTFNKYGNCVNARYITSGYNQEELENYYYDYTNNWKQSISNVKIKDNKLYFNRNVYIGQSKEQIINSLKEYNADIIEY